MTQKANNDSENGRSDIDIPEFCSLSAKNYLKYEKADVNFFHFIIDVVIRTDFVRHTAKNALDGNEFPKDLSPGDLAAKEPGNATKYLRKNKQTLLQMFLSRQIDNFTTYLSEIIREAMLSKPDILKSKEQIRIDYALSHNTIEDLRSDLIDKKVIELGYLGFYDLCEWVEDRMGVKLVQDNSNKEIIVEYIETRNAITHNRGIVGEKYLRIVSSPDYEQGEKRKLDVDDLFSCGSQLTKAVISFDEQITKKFGIGLVIILEKSNAGESDGNSA